MKEVTTIAYLAIPFGAASAPSARVAHAAPGAAVVVDCAPHGTHLAHKLLGRGDADGHIPTVTPATIHLELNAA